MRMDIKKVQYMDRNTITPVIILNMDLVSKLKICDGMKAAGKDEMMYIRLSAN